MVNLSDYSFQVTPELLCTGFHNFALPLRLYLLHGASTDFGEKANSCRIEPYARNYPGGWPFFFWAKFCSPLRDC